MPSGLSPQFILRASLARKLKEVAKENAEALANGETIYRHNSVDGVRSSGELEIENLTWYQDYAEPGYSLRHDAKGILAANWNYFHRGVDDLLERAGFETEWSDEWTACDDCGKAVRTSGDCYSWQRFYAMTGRHECDTICFNCIDWKDYLKEVEDNASMAVPRRCNPAEHGYVRVSQPREYENGWREGMHDNPKAILAKLHAKGEDRIIFRIPETSQFYIKFETWQRAPSLESILFYCKLASADDFITDDNWDKAIKILESLQKD
jgi:hypothetical protein